MSIGGNLDIELVGRGPTRLSDNDYVTSGGEGAIYKKGDTIIKIYTDPEKMVRDGMIDKVKALSVIKHDYIVSPTAEVIDKRGKQIGFYMPYVKGESLPPFFTNSHRDATGFGLDETIMYNEGLRVAVQVGHDHNSVLVDHNELNCLVVYKNGVYSPAIIDVDSWSIGRWPATVIMPSVRDYHSQEFNELTDWFTWGVVTFQLFTGTHPYKGSLDGYKRRDLIQRMKDNASVFTPGVRLNCAVRDFNTIPTNLLSWYEATFQQGERCAPPSLLQVTAQPARKVTMLRTVVSSQGTFKYEKIFGNASNAVLRVWPSGIALMENGSLVHLEKQRVIGEMKSRDGEVVKVLGGWLVADRDSSGIFFKFLDGETSMDVVFQLRADRVLRYQERMFVVTQTDLVELQFFNMARPILSSKKEWGVMVRSTKWFNGFGIQDALGAMFLALPMNDEAFSFVRARELDGLTPVAGILGRRYVVVVCIDNTGEYKRFEFVLDKSYQHYDLQVTDVDGPDLNVAMLPRGVSASIEEDGLLTIFVPSNGDTNPVKDGFIKTTMRLANIGENVVCIEEGTLSYIRTS